MGLWRRPATWLAPVLAGLALLAATAGTAQSQTLTFASTGSASVPSNDVTAFVDKVEIVRVLDGIVMTGALANAGFETPAIGAGNFVYRPSGATWTFLNNTGVSSSGGGFSPPAIQEGTQTGLIQASGTGTSSISQPLTLAAGTYRVRFLAVQRNNCCGAPYDQGLTLSVGGVQVGATTPPVGSFTSYTSNAFTVNGSGAVTTNNALAFDGVDDYVAVPSTATVPTGNSPYTLEAWIKPTSMGVFGIMGWGNYGTTNQVNALRLDPSGVLYNYWWSNDLGVNVGNISGRWHHVAATFDGTTRRLFLDGVQVGADTPTGHNVPNANNLRIGSTCPVPCGGELFPGSIDETRIYNTALTLAQIQADMFSTTPAVPASLQLYYNFDQGTAGGTNTGLTSLTDQSGKGNTGTLTNFALTGTTSNWVRSFPTITGISPSSGTAGSSVIVSGTNLLDANGFKFNTAAVAPFTTPTDDFFTTLTVPTGASTGPISVSSATLAKYNGPVFTFLAGDLVVSTTMTIPPATYNNITVTGPNGNGTLGGDVVVNGALVVQSGGTLADGCNIFTGTGTFTLAAGGTLSICRPRGILAVGDPQGNIGTVRVTGGRSFSNDASYIYAGADATGSGLPS